MFFVFLVFAFCVIFDLFGAVFKMREVGLDLSDHLKSSFAKSFGALKIELKKLGDNSVGRKL